MQPHKKKLDQDAVKFFKETLNKAEYFTSDYDSLQDMKRKHCFIKFADFIRLCFVSEFPAEAKKFLPKVSFIAARKELKEFGNSKVKKRVM